uniref:RNase H type-1 domain-containing protein n=1 Tax=Lactuca sativa TaxID=4236 RepID=A0A9R1W0G6_LACSA|nr:hypothetical protein LSAT_V11C400197270 [Lactuca sativa]
MEEKQLKGDLVEVARSLCAKFDAENAKGPSREGVQPKEIFMIRIKRSREEQRGEQIIVKPSARALTVYVDIGSSADIIYEHCFRLLPDRWKDNLRPTTGRLVGFTGNSLWPLGMIHLPLTITSHDKQRKKTALIDFVVIRHSAEHNIILGRTSLLKLGAVPSTMHGIMKFDTPKGEATILATPPRELWCYMVMKPAEITKGPKRPRGNPEKGKEVINEGYPDQPIDVGSDLPSPTRRALVDLLKRYKHVFAWTPTDMVRVERKVIEHKLMIKPGVKEVKQKKRVQGGDRNRAINVEVSKLTEAGIVREATFPTWIVNPVMVRKQDGSWRMFINFSDLNKACPKDCYPLPEIDQKILMSKEDEEKTAFYTDHGTFCYTKMPFGLKNAEATYQRLVDSIFAKQIGSNIEVYVDDMVIKSPNEEKMLQDIEETFKTLEVTKMKLNPAKCTFGVEEGQFLGYYVTRQGVQPSPTKVDEFIKTATPNSLRDAQGLNGKLTTLSRFISKSVDKAMPLFHTLKGCIEKNNSQWTNEAEKALQRIKEALHKLPTLATPIPRETLRVYLSTSGEAISSILLKPETLGRLAKWAIELGEHDINYRPKTSIKGHELADFLLEIPDGGNPAKEKVWVVEEAPTDDGSWTLYTDGASSREGSGAGLILTSPEGEEVTYALRFDFHTSNNEAEYEALLAGLRLAKQMGAKAVTALTDSRLAANQVNGSFEIPRSENKRADALSKLASTCFDHLSKKVSVEVLRERSIDEQQVNILTPAGPTWMTPFREYLQRGVLPDDHDEARKIRIKAPSYAMVNGELYKKGFTSPWLKCLDQAKGREILQEAHSG